MSSSSFQLRRPTVADFDAADAIAMVAYAGTKMTNPDGAEPSEFTYTPEGSAACKASHDEFCRDLLAADPERHIFEVMVEVDVEDNKEKENEKGCEGKVVGWMAWGRVPDDEEEEREKERVKGVEGNEEEEKKKKRKEEEEREKTDSAFDLVAKEVMERNKEDAKRRVFPNGEYKGMWELWDIAVLPEYQGRGLGTRMLRRGLDVAEDQGRDLFMFARAPAVPFYVRAGVERAEGGEGVCLSCVHDLLVWRHGRGKNGQ